jgi:3-deoxy-7-phosphoheptulonate synthase
MDDKRIYNVNVIAQDVLLTPDAIKDRVPMTSRGQVTVLDGRQAVENVLDRTDHRLLVVVGPCSIHDPSQRWTTRIGSSVWPRKSPTRCSCDAGLLREAAHHHRLEGLINDPHMNDSFDIEEGLQLARKCCSRSTRLGLRPAPRRWIQSARSTCRI